ncbi:hypothetical protein BUE80_DR000476 [Diplocarpon rosae]|nr:hypothetical protein BUE80_DR000476 [Diplocarpon rosae]
MLKFDPMASGAPENNDPNHVLRAECHKCTTLGLECPAVHRDTECDRCLSMGVEYNPKFLRRRFHPCRIANNICTGVKGACDSCSQNLISGCSLLITPEPLSSGSIDEASNADKLASKRTCKNRSPASVPEKSTSACCRCCGDTSVHSNRDSADKCSRCAIGEEDSNSGVQNFQLSNNESRGKFISSVKQPGLTPVDGRHVVRACLDCFKPNLDPGSSSKFCEPCENMINSLKNSTIREHEKSRSGKNSAGSAQIDNRSFGANSASARPLSALRTFQPCKNCQRSGLDSDNIPIQCTKCRERDEGDCHYEEPPRYIGELKTCPGCLQPKPNPSIDNLSDLCQDCEAPSSLPRLQKGATITTPNAWVPKTNISGSATTSVRSNVSQQVASASEIPQFLEFVNTRLSALRQDRDSSSPAPTPNFPPTLSGMTPSPCLACLDQQIACAFHPDPQRYGVFNSIVAALTIQDRDPSLAIPCLACFDEETICAQHETQNADNKPRVLQVAQFCGSCRLAEQECDAVEAGCGRCEEQALECLYIRGSAPPADELLDSAILSGHQVSQFPTPPVACGGCRMAAVACDGLKPGCTACKDQGLDCMYIAGITSPSPKQPVSVVLKAGRYETDETIDGSHSQLEVSGSVQTSGQQSDVIGSQLENSIILKSSSEGNSSAIHYGESQNDELEGGDWDVISCSEDYEVIEAGEKRSDSDREEAGTEFRFW